MRPEGDRSDMSYEQRFLEQLPTIDAVIRHIAYRHHLSADERDEFASLVRLRLVEQDYAVLRGFEGRSSLRTYLTTVITRLFLDERIKAWGKWRPSAEAMRLGPTAVALERLLTRDQVTMDEALGILTTATPGLSPAALHDMAARLPARVGRHEVSDDMLATLRAEGPSPDAAMDRATMAATRATAWSALLDAMTMLEPRERLILRLRYEKGCTVAHIAQVLRVEQKPLYRQIDRLLLRLREALLRRGISAAVVRDVCDMPDELPSAFSGIGDPASVSVMRAVDDEASARGVGR